MGAAPESAALGISSYGVALVTFGTGATELVHIGQTAMGLGGTVDFFIDTVFN